MDKQIILNRIRTPDGTILTSYYRHDYVTHIDSKNGLEYMCDGGLDYLRRNNHKEAPYEELSVYSDEPFEIIRESFHRGGRGINGDQPLTWVAISKMNDNWLQATIEYNTKKGMEDTFATKMYIEEQEYRKLNNIKIDE